MVFPNGLLASSALLFFTFALLFVIGLGSPYWVTTTWEFRHQLGFNLARLGPGSQSKWIGVYYGLWKVCGQTRTCVYWVHFGDVSDSLRATQVFMCFGLFSVIAGCLAYGWWLMRPHRPVARRLSVFFCLLTGFLGLLSICVFGNQFRNAMSLVGWGFWNTAISTIGLLVTGFSSMCLLSVCPITENKHDIEVNLDPIKERPIDLAKKPSPLQDGSENRAYAPTPSGGGPSNPRDSKLSYAESLNSSIAGGSVIGFGMLGQRTVQLAPSVDLDSIGPVDSSSRGYYMSDPKGAELKRPPPPVAPKPTVPAPQESPSPAQHPQYVYSTPGSKQEKLSYVTPTYLTQTSTPHSESDV
ncbi:hypothetical protein CAPTEDRAFT_198064 [Capitella teleta]|uniref:Claudin n=1 Tax=Capitella teleta TaxID=283909 RepID=X1ZY94_CAPTE|nr:hypothetical protein CAPTEDRAFT_198064 [Capitella teleta]|eukprot:ELU04617.1 hypothetical protein CAPTEDRAFT_198064 [Capitella teleta]